LTKCHIWSMLILCIKLQTPLRALQNIALSGSYLSFSALDFFGLLTILPSVLVFLLHCFAPSCCAPSACWCSNVVCSSLDCSISAHACSTAVFTLCSSAYLLHAALLLFCLNCLYLWLLCSFWFCFLPCSSALNGSMLL
jgi:hypothetical protein